MKILALYDIHGNPDALDAVLGDSRTQAPDVVVVGGDAVPGPLTRQVLDRLDGFNVPVLWVRGNGEREVAAAAARASGFPDRAFRPKRNPFCAAGGAAGAGAAQVVALTCAAGPRQA